MPEINLTDKDNFIVAHYNEEESFSLQMNNIGPQHVMNLIGHLAVLLETKENISVEQIAKHLVASQGGFEQIIQLPEEYGE